MGTLFRSACTTSKIFTPSSSSSSSSYFFRSLLSSNQASIYRYMNQYHTSLPSHSIIPVNIHRSFSTKPVTSSGKGGSNSSSQTASFSSSSSSSSTPTNKDNHHNNNDSTLASLPSMAPPTRPATLILELKVKSFHHVYLNQFVIALNKRVENLGLPTPSTAFLPKRIQRWTVLRSPHVDKKARDQFERITHKRAITIRLPYIPSNIELAYRLLRSVSNISANVDIRTKYMVSQGSHIIR